MIRPTEPPHAKPLAPHPHGDKKNTPASIARRGMTLVEVVIAMSIFTIGLLGVLSLAMFSNTTASAGIHRNAAFQSMQGLMEQIRGQGVGVLLQLADAPAGTRHLPLIYFDPLKNNGAGAMPGGPLGFPRRDPDDLVNVTPLVVNGRTVSAPNDRVFVNDPEFKAIPGTFVNAAMTRSATGTESIRAATPLSVRVRILLRRIAETNGSEGVAVDLLFQYDLPSQAGGMRTESGALRTFIANTQVF